VRQYNAGMLRLVDTDEEPAEAMTGEQLLRQVADLIALNLPMVPLEDPDRGVLASLVLAAPPVRSARGVRRVDH